MRGLLASCGCEGCACERSQGKLGVLKGEGSSGCPAGFRTAIVFPDTTGSTEKDRKRPGRTARTVLLRTEKTTKTYDARSSTTSRFGKGAFCDASSGNLRHAKMWDRWRSRQRAQGPRNARRQHNASRDTGFVPDAGQNWRARLVMYSMYECSSRYVGTTRRHRTLAPRVGTTRRHRSPHASNARTRSGYIRNTCKEYTDSRTDPILRQTPG